MDMDKRQDRSEENLSKSEPTNTELNSCPFCGVELIKCKTGYYHPDNYCIACEISLDNEWVDENGKTDIERWNRREPARKDRLVIADCIKMLESFSGGGLADDYAEDSSVVCNVIQKLRQLSKAEQARKEYKLKYAKDSLDEKTVGEIVDELRAMIDANSSNDELCDYLDEEFFYGAWEYVTKDIKDTLFFRDLRGLIIAMYRKSKPKEPVRKEIYSCSICDYCRIKGTEECENIACFGHSFDSFKGRKVKE